MSNLILKIEELFDALFNKVPDSFNGEYRSDNEEIKEMFKEIYDEEFLPSAKEDRKNLKNDGSNILNDLNKAFKSYKEEKCTT